MSCMNLFKAIIRCRKPRVTRSHSFADMIRGIMSKGQALSMLRSDEYTVKLTPISLIARSAAVFRARISLGDMLESNLNTARAFVRGLPLELIISSKNSVDLYLSQSDMIQASNALFCFRINIARHMPIKILINQSIDYAQKLVIIPIP